MTSPPVADAVQVRAVNRWRQPAFTARSLRDVSPGWEPMLRAIRVVALPVLAMAPVAQGGTPQAPAQPSSVPCPLQSDSPAWMAGEPAAEPLRLPSAGAPCTLPQPPAADTGAAPTGLPGQYYPDPMLQRDYMLMGPR